MSKEVLKTAYINFQAKGVQEIRTLITHLGKDLDKFSASLGQSQLKVANKLGDISNKIKESVKKANEAVLVGTKASTVALGKEVSALKLINKEFRELSSHTKEFRSIKGKSGVRLTQKFYSKSPELIAAEVGKENAMAELLKSKSLNEMSKIFERQEDRKLKTAKEIAKTEKEAAKEAAREKLRAAKEAAREEKAAAREAETRRKNFSNRAVAIAKFLGKLGLAAYGDYQNRMGLRSENLRYENLLMLSGIGNARARNYAAKMVSLGGSTEGALGTLNALSSSLGGIARGDTGLLQTLGMYGIGGISPRTSPEQLINKIRARVQRGDLSKNEINALLSQLPLDDAQKRAIMSSRADLFSGELGAFSVDERNIQALEKNAIATESLRSSNEKALVFFSPIDNKISGLIKSNSDLIAEMMTNSNAVKELAGLIPQIGSSLANSLSGALTGALSALLATKTKDIWDEVKNIGSKVGGSIGSFISRLLGGATLSLTPTPLGDGTIDGNLHRLSEADRKKYLDMKYGLSNLRRLQDIASSSGKSSITDSYNTTNNNYNIYYSHPQQNSVVPFYLRNPDTWERNALYYAPNY